MKLKILFATLPFIFFVACKKEDAPGATNTITISYNAIVTPEQEIPTHSSNANGTFNAVYSSATKMLAYNLSYTVVPGTTFSPTVAHIHKGAAGVDGNDNIIFDLGNVSASPITGSVSITGDQLTDLNNSNFYVHIHSSAFPNGDIRGQIHKQ